MSIFKVLLLGLLIVGALAKHVHQDNEAEEQDQLDMIAEDEMQNDQPVEDVSENQVDGGYVEDPCLKKHCGTGRICEVTNEGEAVCVCVKQCPEERDDRRKVCSNNNETWDSDCELYRMRCMCTDDMEDCKDKKYKHTHVNYYGSCRDIPECIPDEMEDFPRRMKEWLFNIMKDLADRSELKEEYVELEREAEKDLSKKWANAVIWKFCDLDSHPFDRSVSRHELFPIRAPLLAMEHCIAPFLDSCDADDDHRITLKEWGLCLGLEESEIEDKCVEIRDNED